MTELVPMKIFIGKPLIRFENPLESFSARIIRDGAHEPFDGRGRFDVHE